MELILIIDLMNYVFMYQGYYENGYALLRVSLARGFVKRLRRIKIK